MKALQWNVLQSAITADAATKAGTSLKVSNLGPLTIAVQISITSFSAAVSGTVQLQGSLDGTNFFNVGSSVSVAANGELAVTDTAPAYIYYRILAARASGSFVGTPRFVVYGDTV